jgi:hypothetical protein
MVSVTAAQPVTGTGGQPRDATVKWAASVTAAVGPVPSKQTPSRRSSFGRVRAIEKRALRWVDVPPEEKVSDPDHRPVKLSA